MDNQILNLKDLEEKVNKKNKYLTDFLTPLETRKIEEFFNDKKFNEIISAIKYSNDSVELERTKIYLIKTEMIYDVIDYSNYDSTFDIQILKIEPNKFARKLVHKDYLGTLLGLGLKREKIGDIIVNNDNTAYVFVSNDISEYILENLKKIGHETVRVNCVKTIKKENIVDDYKERDLTITSYRVDNLISHALGISRQISSSLIEKEYVKINFETNTNNLYEIKKDDLISVRGYGRIKIILLDGDNKKGRHRVKVYVYTKDKR